jgi:acetyltransferase-like isoleucine patch superfamily enzyme
MQRHFRDRLRAAVRTALVFAAIVLTSPFWVLARIERACTWGESLFLLGSQVLSLVPGSPGICFRRGYCAMTLDAFSWDCHIGFGTVLAHAEVRISRGVYVGHHCSLGKVILEDHVTIGSNVDLISGRHQHSYSDPTHPVQDQAGRFVQIRIGENTWIGNSAVVMADVGQNAVIGAGSVVVKPIAPFCMAAGNPARVKKTLAARGSDSRLHPAAG